MVSSQGSCFFFVRPSDLLLPAWEMYIGDRLHVEMYIYIYRERERERARARAGERAKETERTDLCLHTFTCQERSAHICPAFGTRLIQPLP